MNLKRVVKQLIAATAAVLLMGATPRADAATFTIANGDVAGLKSAINTANTNNVADTINLASGGTYDLTTVATTTNGPTGLPIIVDDLSGADLTIKANGATLRRDFNNASLSAFRLLQIGAGATVALSNLTLTGGKLVGDDDTQNTAGSAILNDHATLTLSSCVLSVNDCDAAGAILNFEGVLTIIDTLFDNNENTTGSAIYSYHGTLNCTNCTFNDNFSVDEAGAIYADGEDGTFTGTLTSCVFTNNTASGNGGAIINDTATLSINNCTFTGNRADTPFNGGGAIYNDSGTVTLTNSTLSTNVSATGFGGGAIYNDAFAANATLNLTNCTLSNNTSAGTVGGGAIYNDGGFNNSFDALATIKNCTFKSNIANTSAGGGILNTNSGKLAIGSTLISDSTGSSLTNANTVQGSTITTLGFNLTSDNGGGFLTAATDIKNTNPLLSGLASNGGQTQTHALAANSPAIDKGKDLSATGKDQRGLLRPYDNPAIANAAGGDGSDIGAFEVPGVTLPTLVVSDPFSSKEGSASAPGSATFTVTLSEASGKTVTVNYKTTDGVTNGAKAGSDYVARSGTLTFAPGETSKTVKVIFVGDAVAELNEPFFFDIKTPSNATIADGRGSTYIKNDDGPGMSIANAVTVDEGNSGTKAQTFIVTLSAASPNTVTVNYTTANGTAGPADYTVQSGVLTFAPGETSKIITVLVKGDTTMEPTETYKVNLVSPTYAILTDSQGSAYIRNDDVSALLFEDEAPSE